MKPKGTTIMSKEQALVILKDVDSPVEKHDEARIVLKKAGFSTALIHKIEDWNV